MAIRLLLITILTIGTGSIVFADRPLKPGPEWAYLVEELHKKGISGDTHSVVEAALTHSDPEVRWMAVDLLGRRGDKEAEGALRTILLSDQKRLVRTMAALALVRLGCREVLEQVRQFMATSEDPAERIRLAGQLAEFGDFSGYHYIVDAARSSDEHLRYLSAGYLAPFQKKGFVGGKENPHPREILIALLRDSSTKVRKEALLQVSLVSSQGVPIGPYLEIVRQMSRKDPDSEVRESARLALISWQELLRRDKGPN